MKEMIYSDKRIMKVLETGVYKNVKYAILSLGTHPTAYVENIIEVSDYMDERLFGVEVHGGFTYLDMAYWDSEDKSWYLGWDYAHYNDFMGYYTPKDEWLFFNTKRWTFEEIQLEVFHVIDQLLKRKNALEENK